MGTTFVSSTIWSRKIFAGRRTYIFFLVVNLIEHGDEPLKRKIYLKPTSNGQYIHFDSFVVLKSKQNVILSDIFFFKCLPQSNSLTLCQIPYLIVISSRTDSRTKHAIVLLFFSPGLEITNQAHSAQMFYLHALFSSHTLNNTPSLPRPAF